MDAELILEFYFSEFLDFFWICGLHSFSTVPCRFFGTFLCFPLVFFGFKRFLFVPCRFWQCFSRFAIQEIEKIGKIDKINKIDRTDKIDKIDKINKIR